VKSIVNKKFTRNFLIAVRVGKGGMEAIRHTETHK
jgi:hypothetical protein